MASKEELLRLCAKWEAKIEAKDEELAHLRLQVDKLQDALVAKEAPQAYAELNRRQAEREMSPEDIEAQAQARKEARMAKELIEQMEGPIFTSVDDLKSTLVQTIGPPKDAPVGEYPDEG